MPIVSFILDQGDKLFRLPLILWICDTLVTSFLRLAFGSTIGMFRPRFTSSGKNTHAPSGRRRSVKELL